MSELDAHEATVVKIPGVAVFVLCSWGASILIPLTLWSAASRTGPFRHASDEARITELDPQRPLVPPQVPGNVRVVLAHPATDALWPKDAKDLVPAQPPPPSRAFPSLPDAAEAADKPSSAGPSAPPQEPAQAEQATVAAVEPRAWTADAVDGSGAAESRSGAGLSVIPTFLREPQLTVVREKGLAPLPHRVGRREARLRDEFRAHGAAHSYHYRRVMVRRWAPPNPFVSFARLLFH